MRAFFDLVETGRLYLHASELRALDATLLAALRASGIVRDEDPGMVDVSAPDLARTLRVLYGALARGTALPPTLDARPVVLGWIPEDGTERELVLLAQPSHGLAQALARPGPARVLVPTARQLTPALRARHARGSRVEVEALDESLVVFRRRLARKGGAAPRPGARPAPTHGARGSRERITISTGGGGAATLGLRPQADGIVKAGAEHASCPFPGATSWRDVRISILDQGLVRVDAGSRSFRCTPGDLGMAHPRSRRPTLVWEALIELCEHKGIFKTRRFGEAVATKKLVSRLRARLHVLFGIDPSPFYRYRKGTGWAARFSARPDPPGEGDDDLLERLERDRRRKRLGDKSQRHSVP